MSSEYFRTAPPLYEQFAQTADEVAWAIQTGALEHTATEARVTADQIYLKNHAESDPRKRHPYDDYDLLVINMGGRGLSICLEHRHAASGDDHDATVGFERSTVTFGNVTIQKAEEVFVQEFHTSHYRVTAGRVYGRELITDSEAHRDRLTGWLTHTLAAVGIQRPMSEEASHAIEVLPSRKLSEAA